MNDLVIFDLETTGLNTGAKLDEAVQFAACDYEGRELYSTLIRVTIDIDADASKTHGIDAIKLMKADAPYFLQIEERISALLADAEAVAGYNVGYDIRVLMNAYHKARKLMPVFEVHDVMMQYAATYGEPDDRYGFKAQRLTAALEQQGLPLLDAHDALADAQMTAALLRHIDSAEHVRRYGDALPLQLVSIERRTARNGKPYASFKSIGGAVVNVFSGSPIEGMFHDQQYPLAGWVNRLQEGAEQALSRPIEVSAQPVNGFLEVKAVHSVYKRNGV